MSKIKTEKIWNAWALRFENYLKLERSLSQNSVIAYRQDLKKLKQWDLDNHSLGPFALSQAHAQAFLATLATFDISSKTQARMLSSLKAFYKYLSVDGQTHQNPFELLESPRLGQYLPDILHFEEIETLLNSIDLSDNLGFRNRAIIELLYSSGLRVSELINLRIHDLMPEIAWIKVTGKGNKQRMVPVGQEALQYTLQYIKEIRPQFPEVKDHTHYLFLNRRGRKLTRVMIFTIIKRLTTLLGWKKKVSPHTFRHSFATHLVKGGADLRVVQELLGHVSINTTEIYTHLDKRYLRDTVDKFHPRNTHKS